MVYVVAPESGTVAPPPESELCEKLPSGDVSEHVAAFFDVQKIVVRAPSGTDAGTAQISAEIGGDVGTGAATFVVLAGCEGTFFCVSVT